MVVCILGSSYETENGIKAEERGIIRNAGIPDAEEQVVTGAFSFVADDGQIYSVTYVADSNGFRAFGDHIPTSLSQTKSPPSPKLTTSPSPRPQYEVEALSRFLVDPQGLTPPPLPPQHPKTTLPAGLVYIPMRPPRESRLN